MGKLKVSGFVLLFSALVGLTTCQLQFNRAGNSVALRVLIPGKLSGMTRGAFATASTPRSLAGGASLTVTIMQEGGSSSEQQMVSLNGQTSIDFSFTVSSSGSYQISALLQDVNANILAQRTAQVELPANYPVVLPLYSSLLSDVIVTDSSGTQIDFTVPFTPTTYDYTTLSTPLPIYLTLTTMDPDATVSVTQSGAPIQPTGSVYAILATSPAVIIVVTAADGTASVTYTYTLIGT